MTFKRMTYFVIEPHADDAFLSLHEHMRSWIARGDKVVIFTIFSNEKRDKEAEEYARKIGASSVSLRIKDQSHLGLPPKPCPPFSEWGISEAANAEDQIIFPAGLQHPDHKTVRVEAPEGWSCWFYLDTPYQAKIKLEDELMRRIRGRRIVSVKYPSRRKWKYVETFKSQAKFFHYNPPESLHRIPEIIVRA